MTKRHDNNMPISPKKFMHELWRYKRGSVTRRHFLGVTGLGMATAVMASAMPSLLRSGKAHAATDIGDRVSIATWPNYFNRDNYEAFTKQTGAHIQVSVFGSNEEMLAKLQAGGTGWDVFVPTNYTISTYQDLDLIQPLDLSRLPNFDPKYYVKRFMEPGTIDGVVYAVPKNWGTTGFVVNRNKIGSNPTSWKEFWNLAKGDASGRVIVHDYQLTTIGNALVSLGYSFNSIDPNELAEAEELLLEVKPHLFAITSDYQPGMRSGDAWMSIAWVGDGLQLHRDLPEIDYVLGDEGGELWSDFYAIPKSAPRPDAAYALINYLLDPAVNAREAEAHGYPVADERSLEFLPESITENPIVYPAREELEPLEFGAAVTLTSERRAELMARFKAA
ncbi:MAG: spermidine/putrescine ABC transporter substrate-binding protein [Gammaproteobacteria bacterium]|nr:spermidine/putrescine ABC transporter substrate-binding protein [Gammaproteobacteria bacterium]NIR84315.1 spermidine/putrescine ABC transporter substrate-binding protein [Gammaproteobacteria bacterium]NIR89830.1 spermidine/putrescine ABC transporter substrate-binding protein [Gammaproteobacteria bacterium]NIU05697.1 spermidine/putrescine ABC transporter substrate-binding protein [Gammaproteobacteria bacterium]NIV52457.1 extracellular solute-binding protein [Gammaproteobacteria bacterium]